MSWHQRYQLREFLRSSFWFYPSFAVLLAWVFGKLIISFVPDVEWPSYDQSDIDGLRALMGLFSSSMLTFIVYAVSALLLAVQLASGQTTPRLIRLTFGRWQMKFATSAFVFAFGVTLVALANTNDESRHAVIIMLAVAGNVASIPIFFWFVQEVGLGLRPIAVLQHIFVEAKDAMDSVYVGAFDPTRPEANEADELAGRESRVVRRTGLSGTFLAFGSRDLAALATRTGCTIELIPQVGDFVSTDDPLARIYPPNAAVDEAAINALTIFGPERTMRQDPMFGFRIMVDIASRALSPAVNDPTTAVVAIDQIHRLLRYAGNKALGGGHVRDLAGNLRLVFPTPNWDDIVALAVTEVRQYGASSTQVARRLRAMLEHLIDRLPPQRAAALEQEMQLLARSVEHGFAEAEDRRRASIADFQGLGGSSLRTDL